MAQITSQPLKKVDKRTAEKMSFQTTANNLHNLQVQSNCDSLSIFKSRLKTHLFSTAFC